MKVKVLDAMARGIPTVTTRVGAEGIDVENGRELLVADDPAQMAAQIDDLLANPALWQQLQSSSRALIRERYTWQRLFAQMHASIDRGLKAHRRSRVAVPGVKVLNVG
jgi:glycosyltransferase involved in cell wall biosynthesis